MQLENNILLVQKRAMEQADIDPLWLGPEEENYTIAEPEFRGVLCLHLLKFSFFFCYNKKLYKFDDTFYRVKRVHQRIHLESRI